MSENSMGVKCLALNVRATNVWKSKWALNVRRQMSENSHWPQMSLGVKCHMPISCQMSLASIVTTSNWRQRSGLKSLGDKHPGRQTAWSGFWIYIITEKQFMSKNKSHSFWFFFDYEMTRLILLPPKHILQNMKNLHCNTILYE